ncbi:DUF2202 domain-containing protein [Candidatus Gracilibacteria bacterium]|nr:DUF2202 domain-containing protein [Candidatus Gracilibacteria bacterium]
MKTTQKLFVGIATVALIATTLSFASVNAAGGNGGGYGQGMGRNSGTTNTTRIAQSEALTLSGVATSPLTEQEKLDLAYQYSEEMVARDAYTYFYSLYNIPTFQNIAASEQEHMDAVKTLLERYSLPIPTGYGELENTFATLKAEGEKGAKEALEVGLKIEILDIKDIVETIKATDNTDIKIVLTNIGGASYNHMRGFLQGLSNNGYTTTIDTSSYLTQSDLATRGNLKSKLSEKLASEGISIPTQASVTNIQAQNLKDQNTLKLKQGYQQNIEKTYGKKMGKMNNTQLSRYTGNIDKTLNRVKNSNTLSSEKKEQKVLWYTTMKEYIGSFFQ